MNLMKEKGTMKKEDCDEEEKKNRKDGHDAINCKEI